MMKKLGLIGAALVAVLALSALVFAPVSSAGLPELLPTGRWTGVSDNSRAEGGPLLETLARTRVLCEKAKAEGADETDTLGQFHIKFEGCEQTALKARCKGMAGDVEGEILSLGTYHHVYDVLGTGEALGVAILFLPTEVSFECGPLVRVRVKVQSANGGVICLWLEPLVSRKTHLFHCEQEIGDQKESRYWNDGGTLLTRIELLCEINNSGRFESCAELALGTVTYGEPVAFMNE
ncbi:MAG TPA: hypothetical protein VK272_07430 [Solirubrobacteraceae bacterium]|nr:hypothetical protein [Solirubrobacteraceae bacterium]